MRFESHTYTRRSSRLHCVSADGFHGRCYLDGYTLFLRVQTKAAACPVCRIDACGMTTKPQNGTKNVHAAPKPSCSKAERTFHWLMVYRCSSHFTWHFAIGQIKLYYQILCSICNNEEVVVSDGDTPTHQPTNKENDFGREMARECAPQKFDNITKWLADETVTGEAVNASLLKITKI